MSLSITPEGTVLKDGETLGTIIDGVMLHSAPISGVVKGQIRKAADNPELQFDLVQDGQEAEVVPLQPFKYLTPLMDAFLAQTSKPSEDGFKTLRQLAQESIHNKVLSGEMPPPPPTMPALGQKTPEYVAWVKQHATEEEFTAMYPPHRKLPTHESHDAALKKLAMQAKLGTGDEAFVMKI